MWWCFMDNSQIPWGRLAPAEITPTVRVKDVFKQVLLILQPEYESWPHFNEKDVLSYAEDPNSDEAKKLHIEQKKRRQEHGIRWQKLLADASKVFDALAVSGHIICYIQDWQGQTRVIPWEGISRNIDKSWPPGYGHNWIVWSKGHLFAPANPTYKPFSATYDHKVESLLLIDKRSHDRVLKIAKAMSQGIELDEALTSVDSPLKTKRGARPRKYWDKIYDGVRQKIQNDGYPHSGNVEGWNKQADVETMIKDLAAQSDNHPSDSTVRRHATILLEEAEGL